MCNNFFKGFADLKKFVKIVNFKHLQHKTKALKYVKFGGYID